MQSEQRFGAVETNFAGRQLSRVALKRSRNRFEAFVPVRTRSWPVVCGRFMFFASEGDITRLYSTESRLWNGGKRQGALRSVAPIFAYLRLIRPFAGGFFGATASNDGPFVGTQFNRSKRREQRAE